MRYSIFKYGFPLLSGIEDLEEAKKEAWPSVRAGQSGFLEVRNLDNETVTIGYFDGKRFHWTKDKGQVEAWKGLSFVTKVPLWKGGERDGSHSQAETTG